MPFPLERTLERALKGLRPSDDELTKMLKIRDPHRLARIFETARALRKEYFDGRIFLYGFLYFSTYCKNTCRFCGYRAGNTGLPRYRKTSEEILSAADRLADSGVHLLDLTMGEDPVYFNGSKRAFDPVIELVKTLKTQTGLPVMISPGVISDNLLRKFRDAGADWYACYQETHTKSHYYRLRPGQNYEKRWQGKQRAVETGFLIEEGLLCGAGETDRDIAGSISAMAKLNAHQIRVMQFVPQKGTPMADWSATNPDREILIIALLRLCFPDRLIPASLDVEGLSGLSRRLDAGANVVTSLVPPGAGFAGVSQSELDIESAKRTASATGEVVSNMGLQTASLSDFETWMANQ